MKTAMFQPGLLTMFLACVFSALLAAEEFPGERWATSLDMVVARAGQSWKRNSGDDHYAVLKPFLGPIAAAAKQEHAGRVSNPPLHAAATRPFVFVSAPSEQDDLLERKTTVKNTSKAKGDLPAAAPYPPSRLIVGIRWAPASSIVRHGRGGDNWPITWADDDHLYTAYGDDHFSVRQATLTTSE